MKEIVVFENRAYKKVPSSIGMSNSCNGCCFMDSNICPHIEICEEGILEYYFPDLSPFIELIALHDREMSEKETTITIKEWQETIKRCKEELNK